MQRAKFDFCLSKIANRNSVWSCCFCGSFDCVALFSDCSTVSLCWPCTLEVAQSTGEIQGDVVVESERAFTIVHAKHAVDSSQKQLENSFEREKEFFAVITLPFTVSRTDPRNLHKDGVSIFSYVCAKIHANFRSANNIGKNFRQYNLYMHPDAKMCRRAALHFRKWDVIRHIFLPLSFNVSFCPEEKYLCWL